MPVILKYREIPCRRCKGARGWYKIKAQSMISWHSAVYKAQMTKPVIEHDWVECSRCEGDGRVILGGSPSQVAERLQYVAL